MKFTQMALALLVSAFSVSAFANVTEIQPNTPEDTVAINAANVFTVTNLKIGKTAYKVVMMDSQLNGDVSATTIVLVGEGAVGGAAGYDAAFKITPTEEIISMVSARVKNGRLNLVLSDLEGKRTVKSYLYDAATKTLNEK